MALTASKDNTGPVRLGWHAADFRLKGTDGKFYALADVRGPKGLLVVFMCNHCPYVQAALPRMIRDAAELKALGVGVVGINANDPEEYPDDSFANMQRLAAEKSLPFPYLIDETQEVARGWDAACTPEFYGFDAALKLAYHGRIDGGGMKEPPPGARRELFEAMTHIAATGQGPREQHVSIGCSIKWKT